MAEPPVIPNKTHADQELQPSLGTTSRSANRAAASMTADSTEVGTLLQRVNELERFVAALQHQEEVARHRLEEYVRSECAAAVKASEHIRRWRRANLVWTIILTVAVTLVATTMAFYALTVFYPFEGR